MNFTDLKEHISKIKSEVTNDDWISSLDSRKLKELEFHNKDRDKSHIEQSKANDTYEKFYGNKKYYKTVARSNNYLNSWIQKNASKDKVFLDYACGNGGNAITACQHGFGLTLGLDISDVSISNCSSKAEEMGLEDIIFFQADAENTLLPDNSIDHIICSGMLHHLDLSYAIPELRRILKPGGTILAVEALDINPLIKLYRYFTPDMRTEWEKAHILDLNDIKFAQRFFILREIKFWHVLGYIGGKIPFLAKPLDLVDRILEKIPLLQRLSWIFTFELEKN